MYNIYWLVSGLYFYPCDLSPFVLFIFQSCSLDWVDAKMFLCSCNSAAVAVAVATATATTA